MKENNVKLNGIKWTSWTIIIIAFFIFWPVGLVLLARKIDTDKKAIIESGKFLIPAGWVSILFGIMGLFVSLDEGVDLLDVFMVCFFIGLGVGLVHFGRKCKSDTKKYKRYIAIIINQGETNINNIANNTSLTPDEVKKDLTKMIEKNFFEGAYIDENRDMIIIHKKHTEEEFSSTNKDKRIVSCNSCNATNLVNAGEITECEYCGSYLQG